MPHLSKVSDLKLGIGWQDGIQGRDPFENIWWADERKLELYEMCVHHCIWHDACILFHENKIRLKR